MDAPTITAPDTGAADTNVPAPAGELQIPDSVRKLASLFADTDGPPEEKPEIRDVKPAEKPKALEGTAKPEGGKPEDKPAAVKTGEEPALRVRRDKINRPALPVEDKPVVTAPVVEAYKADPEWEKSLEENEREMLDDAKDAERHFPEKHKGLAARTAKFIREHADLTKKEEFDDQSAKYKEWLDKNQPRLTRTQVRELEEARVAGRVRQEWEGKYQDLQHKLFVREHEPKFEAEGRTLFSELRESALPEDLAKAVKEMGEKAQEVYGMELETAQRVLAVATDDLVEFRRLTTKDPETGRTVVDEITEMPTGNPADQAFQDRMGKFQQHERLRKLVDHLCGDYAQRAYGQNADGKLALRDGRYFVTREEWGRIPAAKRGQYWTFSNAELIAEAKKVVRPAVEGAISKKREEMKKYRWEAPKPTVAPVHKKEEPPPTPTGAVRTPGPSAVPGVSDTPGGVDARIKGLAARLAASGD